MDIKKSIIFNLRWHRRIGLSVFVVMIFLAITGFSLNHSPGLNLSKINLTSDWLLSWYGVAPQKTEGFPLADNWVYGTGTGELYFDNQPLGYCPPPLAAVAATEQMNLALCNGALLLLTKQGQLLETFSQVQGLPASSNRLVTLDQQVVIVSGTGAWEFDLDSLAIKALTDLSALEQASSIEPSPLPSAFGNKASLEGISLETLIIDLHSGRFFGSAGVLFVDLVGLLICILSITGLRAWVNHQRLRKQ